MFPGVLETPLRFIYVTSLSNKRCFYKLWLLVIIKSGKRKKRDKFNRLQIESFFHPDINPPNIGPSNLFFDRLYTQGVLTEFYVRFAINWQFVNNENARSSNNKITWYITEQKLKNKTKKELEVEVTYYRAKKK